jgi:hypothetical protein
MKKFFAQSLAWLGGAVSAGGAAGQFGKYSGIGLIAGPLLTSFGVHLASQTSSQPAALKQ